MLSIIVNKTEDVCAFRKNLNVEMLYGMCT